MTQDITAETKLKRIRDILVQDILETSDEETLAEFSDKHSDPEQEIARIKEIVEKTLFTPSVRVVIIDGKPWFLAEDVAKVLNMRNAETLMKLFPAKMIRIYAMAGEKERIFISEAGLYRAIVCSDTPKIEDLITWITGRFPPFHDCPEEVLVEKFDFPPPRLDIL